MRSDGPKFKKVVGLFIVVIMVLSVFGFVLDFVVRSSVERYAGFRFEQPPQSGLWTVEVDDVEYQFVNFPSELEGLSVDPGAVELLRGVPQVTISFDPQIEVLEDVDLVRLRLTQFFTDRGVYVPNAVTSNSTVYGLPVVTCAQSASNNVVWVLEVGESSRVALQGSCVVMTGVSERDLVELTEVVMYRLLGVMS